MKVNELIAALTSMADEGGDNMEVEFLYYDPSEEDASDYKIEYTYGMPVEEENRTCVYMWFSPKKDKDADEVQ